jgi:exosortase
VQLALPRTAAAVRLSSASWPVAAVLFVVLFRAPIVNTAGVWWSDPDAGHGLLLAPLAVFLAWKRGVRPGARSQRGLGVALLLAAVLMRYAGGLATEQFTMRLSVLVAGAGIVVFVMGARQLTHWWLSGLLLLLAIPLPEVVLGSLALPLQFRASELGTAMLRWRHVPVELTGNVIHLPGHTLFVTEACSGLRSLASLLALGLLIGGLWLRTVPARVLLIALAIPIAVFLNCVRIFLTGFFVHYVDPRLADGLMHYTEGWVMFVVALALLAGVAWVTARAERRFARRAAAP